MHLRIPTIYSNNTSSIQCCVRWEVIPQEAGKKKNTSKIFNNPKKVKQERERNTKTKVYSATLINSFFPSIEQFGQSQIFYIPIWDMLLFLCLMETLQRKCDIVILIYMIFID